MSAVTPETAAAAACSKLRRSGLRQSWSSRAQVNSANVRDDAPNTASPTLKRVTSAPTASTTPLTSMPSTRCFGFVRPVASRIAYGMPAMRCH